MIEIKFGTSGWRGVIANDFTFSNIRVVSQAVAEYVKENGKGRGIIVGYDTRFMTEKFADVVVEVIAGNGIKVHLCEFPTPTPVISNYIIRNELDGGVNLTASHNPPEYCGLKFNPASGGPALPEVTKRVEEFIRKVQTGEIPVKSVHRREAEKKGLVKIIDPSKDYIEVLRNMLDFDAIKRAKLKAIVDVLYGTAKGYLDNVIKTLCEDWEILHDYRDPYFGCGRPEPDRERMKSVGRVVIEKGYHVGLGVDGDADRFGIVDENGDFVTPNEFIAIAAEHLYENRGFRGPVARSIATSHALDFVARAHGEECSVTPVGFKFLGPLVAEKGYVIAGEESGGLSIQNHVPEKDGILAVLLALEMIAYYGKSFSEIRKDFVGKYGIFYNSRIDVKLESEEKKKKLMDEFSNVDTFAGLRVCNKNTMDGYLYEFAEGDSWLLVRPSGTEPLVRIYFESRDRKVFESIESEVRKLV